MAAGQLDVLEVKVAAGKFFHPLAGELRREGQVILGVDDQRFLGKLGIFIHV